jgi:chemotaxis family two-component system sensor kinase Cph1
MQQMEEPVGVCSGGAALSKLAAHDHPCLIYDDLEEQADAYVPYLYGGMAQGELCVYVVDETEPKFIERAFQARGIDICPYIDSGAFRIISKHDAYLTEGHFNIQKMMQFWKKNVQQALDSGFTAVRAAAEMTWALGDEPGVEHLVPYESELNEVFPQLKVSALCQYHRKRFPAQVIKDMIHVHPLVVTGSEVLKNPGFMKHHEFIESHDDMEVQKLLDNITLANRLQQRNEELQKALDEKQKTRAENQELKIAQQQLEKALHAESEMRRHAEELKQELEEFVNNATEGLHWVGADGIIKWANPAELDLLGYEADEYIGRDIREFHADWAAIEEIITRLRNKETLHNFQARLRTKDGSIKTVLISSNVLWRGDEFVHTQCFTRDITEIELAQRQMAQTEEVRVLNEELHSLARIVSHELQEPIAKIRSYLSLLAVRYKGQLGADADEFIDTCLQSAKIVHRMIDDLWLFARMTKIDHSDITAVSVGSVVAGVLHEYKEDIEKQNAVVQVSNMPRLQYAEKQLAYLFEALLDNALRFRRSDINPIIKIDAKCKGNEWVFSVSDNGIGIDPMHYRDIFRAFYSVNSRPGAKGTGMGLAICQKIVQISGGSIWVESKLGEGSTFFFTVPANECKIV